MKVVVDNKIPFIQEAIKQIADEVIYAAGKDFTSELVKDADALIIRTRTHCNRALLEGSKVKFIATATIGFDHIDTDYCREAGITWCNAPGCNACSVVQYVQAALTLYKKKKSFKLKNATMGVIGCGNVGSRIAEMGSRMGIRVLRNDPPRESEKGDYPYSSLEEIASKCDIITFHVPLVQEGLYKTFHMANAAFFASLKKKPLIINTSRGEVIETPAVLDAINKGYIRDAIIDVWENEPTISLDLLDKVFLGTPHIAGYSADGKATATRMALDALCEYFHLEKNYHIEPPQPVQPVIKTSRLSRAILQMYNPYSDYKALKEHPERFEELRGNYPLRREQKAYSFPNLPHYDLF